MASVTEHIIKLQELTQRNLELLQAINDSFFTKQNHLTVTVGDQQYAMPSFISLENKLNSLIANFDNLVHAPESGEAFFNFDGNSRSIQVRPYTSTPNSLNIQPVRDFYVNSNDIFKDFMTPIPYIKLDVKDLPNDTVQVIVKKIIPKHEDLIKVFEDKVKNKSSIQFTYSDLYKILINYIEDKDYTSYDTKIDLPIRQSIGSGVYVVEQIVKDEVDENLDNYLTLKLRDDLQDPIYLNSLKYRLFDETIEKYLKVGDQLVTHEGNAKMEITEIHNTSNTIVVKVLHGEFLNLVPSAKGSQKISSLSKIKFYSPINFDDDKYVQVPLEEDKYVFIAVAALNNRMNVQSSWGSGLMLNTYELKKWDNDKETFNNYYNTNVKNIGDVLYEITSLMSNSLTSKSGDEYNKIILMTPVINKNDLIVTQINKHLNDSVTVQNIRALYSQKKNYQTQLNEIQTEISTINDILTTISFDDTTGTRAAYTAQLNSLSTQQNEMLTSITKIMNEISTSANNSELPIENAKYRIRGFFNYKKFLEDNNMSDLINHVKGIRVQYRYKNVDNEQGNALTINDNFTFSDWNNMKSFDREKIADYKNNSYSFVIQEDNGPKNEPSFNQIDIPISQGETIDIRLKLVFDYGEPFIHTTSNWSQIVNVEFPEEYLKDVKILDIIEENNNDIETNRFNNIIREEGISTHIADKITDQDITYWHKPENIASGFYTAERRIIPLKDKLSDLNNALTELRDEVYGTNSESLKVSIKHGPNITELIQYQIKDIFVEGYNNIDTTNNHNGLYETAGDNKLISTILNISILNDSTHTAKLFSMFPGGRDVKLNDLKSYKFKKDDYCVQGTEYEEGVWIFHPLYEEQCSHNADKADSSLQCGNQFLYFRINDVNTGEPFYVSGNPHIGENVQDKINKLSSSKQYSKCGEKLDDSKTQAYMYPKLSHRFGLSLETNSVGSYFILGPKEEIIIPIVFEYYVKEDTQISKTMSFDILPSLYKDPISYSFRVTAKYQNSAQDKITATNQQQYKNWWGDSGVKYNTTFK